MVTSYSEQDLKRVNMEYCCACKRAEGQQRKFSDGLGQDTLMLHPRKGLPGDTFGKVSYIFIPYFC